MKHEQINVPTDVVAVVAEVAGDTRGDTNVMLKRAICQGLLGLYRHRMAIEQKTIVEQHLELYKTIDKMGAGMVSKLLEDENTD